MKKFSIITVIILTSFIFSRCKQGQASDTATPSDSMQAQVQDTLPAYGGFESEIAWGKHIVTIAGCNDCHTPSKMGPSGPEANTDIALSGSPSQMPGLNIDRKDAEKKGYMVMGQNLAFYGPWGVSYAANITSDSTTGIGNWTLDQFIRVFKTGKYGGAPSGRNLLPPMPWEGIAQMTNDELKALYAYLESTTPVHNIVPQPEPPVTEMKK